MEVKWDGIRAQVVFDRRSLGVRSRRGRSWADEFPELQELAGVLGNRRVVLDGELVCLGSDGKPDFAALRARLGVSRARAAAAQRRSPASLVLFDVLHLDGRAVRELPYCRRRELLAELALEGPAWRTPRQFVGEEGEALLGLTAEQGLEGVVAKRLDSPYMPGRRSSTWVKQKHRRRERFIVTGWRERDRALPEFLLARRAANGSLRPAGSASLGLSAAQRAELLGALAAHELPSRRRRSSVRWAAPIIEVDADIHGPVNGAVRDAVLRSVSFPGAPSQHGGTTAAAAFDERAPAD